MGSAIEQAGLVEEVGEVAGAVLPASRSLPLDPDEALGNLGFDSASLKLLAGRLTERFGVPVDVVALFAFPTLRLLAEHIGDQAAADHSTQIEHASGPTSAPAVDHSRDIAIVGVSCRLPGAASKEVFWANQMKGRNCIREVPAERWSWQARFGDPFATGDRTDVKWGGFIDGEDQFAPDFFGISLYEAELMDPQHRLFIKACWEAVWDAGHDPRSLSGRSVGIFAGVQFGDYQTLLNGRGILSAQACTGNAHAMIANRVSFLLDVNGPSEAIDTACSSSLVAIHRAVRAIRDGECELAFAGGVNLLLAPDMFVMGRQLGVLSPSGQCRTFDAGADGYVRAEGVGVLLLKRLDRAEADRDHVYGVIRGTAVNHGGRATSLTAPNSRAQAELMLRAMKDAAVGPSGIAYVEMHGTGTELGDPIEVEGVKKAFRQARSEACIGVTPCALGSVKTNIGHLEPAAGVAGVLNVLMAMRHRMLPGLSNFRQLNPHLVLDDGFRVQTEIGAWPSVGGDDLPAAMVNSFGFGGANACVVIQQVSPARGEDTDDDVFVPLSASSSEGLQALAADLAEALKEAAHPVSAADCAFTLQSRRDNRPARALLRVSRVAGLLSGLRALAAGDPLPGNVAVAGRPALDAQEWPAFAQAWLATGESSWPDIPRARRAPLPVAPWPDRSCWFEPRHAVAAQAVPKAQAAITCLRREWENVPAGGRSSLDESCLWLIGRSEEQNEAFLAHLRKYLPRKATVVSSVVDPCSWQVEPSLEVWNLAGDEPDVVIMLPDLGQAAGAAPARLMFDLAKALMERSFNREVDVYFAVARGYGATAETDALPALAKSAFLENEKLRVHTLYIEPGQLGNWMERVAAEATSVPAASPMTVRLGVRRSVPRLQPQPLGDRSPNSEAWFRAGGVYLVPGGAGELGRRLIGRLADEIDATFILLGRSTSGDDVTARAGEPTQGRLGRVRFVTCDVTDAEQTSAAVAGIVDRFGSIRGVVNLVTAHKDAFLFAKSWDDFASVSDPKVRGTVNLDQATAGQPLDFFVSFSSLAALGMAGGSDYAYGCAFQNAFAAWRKEEVRAGRRRGASHAISWSRWKWDKYVTEGFDRWFAAMGFEFLDVETGLDAWRALAGQAGGETFLLYGREEEIFHHLDLSAGLLRQAPAPAAIQQPASADRSGLGAPRDTVAPAQGSAVGAGTPALDTSGGVAEIKAPDKGESAPPAGRDELERALAVIIGELLKLDEIERDAAFSALGLDSVMAIRMTRLIEARLSHRLSPTDLLKFPSIARLAEHMLAREGSTPVPGGSVILPTAPDDLDAIASHLASSLKRMLRTEEIAPDDRFGSLGVDSIIAVKLASELNRTFSVGISPRWFLDYPTIDGMAREIGRRRASPS